MQYLAISLLLLSLTQAQELTRTNKLPVESEPEATTIISTDIPELIELTTDAVIAETTTEIPAQADIVPAVATENRNSAVDLSAASESESESKEAALFDDDEVRYSTQRCDSDLVGFEIVTG